ncbi:hypothetical protein PCC7424_4558 [Gloeothece citriformis PCC 7424]|uniref:Uncharacterized protein n=1 Tax=Gloeothece citriformis (strain PCC 7424) TaxID=65393 RepID=B7KAE7_GLOC7|nr:hypothetical protein [Gloeothece citriformis]ACK72921.1 hypothetical protein PCC7424_4558 [Gloeothece citriformis PCC 7424]
MKYLLTTLTLSSLFLPLLPSLAAKHFNLYLPIDKSCAVYKGKIDHAQTFPLWIERNRQLMIETDNQLEVAVSFQNQIMSPYQVNSLYSRIISQYSYRTSATGKHIISIQGKAEKATITFCLK